MQHERNGQVTESVPPLRRGLAPASHNRSRGTCEVVGESRVRPASAADVLDLQRTIGNLATMQALAQNASTVAGSASVQRMLQDTVETPNETGQTDRVQRFYLTLGEKMEFLLATVEFGAAVDLFNRDFWEKRPGNEDALYLKAGKSPADAVNKLHTPVPNPEGEDVVPAKLDCAEIIEVAMWLAELDLAGRQAFDEKYGGGLFSLAAPGSTGIATRSLLIRRGGKDDEKYHSAGGPMDGTFSIIKGAQKGKSVPLADLLPKLRLGSRVMWRNFDPRVPSDDDFKNENTLKVGDDRFAAHPFGTFSLQRVMEAIGKESFKALEELRKNPPPDFERFRREYEGIDTADKYIQKFIRIVEIETYTPPV